MLLSASQASHARLVCGLAGALPAVVEDLRTRQIPNWVCLPLCGAGLVLAVLGHSLVSAVLGLGAGVGSCLVFYLKGGMGGGDVKLTGAYGALLGVPRIWPALFLTAVTGALLAVLVSWSALRRARPAESICYAPAIALGALAVLLADLVEKP